MPHHIHAISWEVESYDIITIVLATFYTISPVLAILTTNAPLTTRDYLAATTITAFGIALLFLMHFLNRFYYYRTQTDTPPNETPILSLN